MSHLEIDVTTVFPPWISEDYPFNNKIRENILIIILCACKIPGGRCHGVGCDFRDGEKHQIFVLFY